MKHFLCLMGRLSPISSLYKTKLSAMVAVMTLFMCLIAAYKAPAQTGAAVNMDEKPLQIGDTIPEELWHLPLQVVNHPEGKETITLNDYRGKLIILDFWATWCGSCIAAMPRLYNFQQQYDDELIILPVTSEAPRKTSQFLSENALVKEFEMFSIIDDGTLKHHFPYNTVPHYVWLGTNFSLYAVTDSEQLTGENISSAISGNWANFVEKVNIDLSNPQPLFLSGDISSSELLEYTIVLKGQHLGLSTYNITRRKDGLAYGRMFTNFPLMVIYESVARQLFKKIGQRYTTKRMLIESNNPEKLSYNPQRGLDQTQWNESYLYSCDFIVPAHMASQLDSVMLQTLNRASGFEGVVRYKNIKCRVLRQKNGARYSIGNKTKQNNRAFQRLILALDHPSTSSKPLVDESGFTGGIDIDVEELKGKPLLAINQKLNPLGLELIEAERIIAMFVIKDSDSI